MKKKLLGLMLCTAILGSMMIGCGSKPAQDSSAAPEKATEESADGELYVYSVFEVISTLAFSVFVFLMSSMTEYFGIRTVFYLAMIATLLEAALIYCKRALLNKG